MKTLILLLLLSSFSFAQKGKILIIGDENSDSHYSYVTMITDTSKIDLTNLSHFGFKTSDALLQIKKDSSKYDMCIIYIGFNDIYGVTDSEGDFISGLSNMHDTELELDSIFYIAESKSDVVIMITPQIPRSKMYNGFIFHFRAYVFSEFIIDNYSKYAYVVNLNEFLISLAGRDSLFLDDKHFNFMGHKLIGNLILVELNKIDRNTK